MSFSIGIVGLPNVGKSTLFNALTKQRVNTSNYPFCTIDPNVGIVKVPDERLAEIAAITKTSEIIHTVIEFVDIAGLVKNAHQGEGLGNQFLSHIREVDAICEVVRAFEDDKVIHVDGKIDPASDIETIKLELIFADLATIDKRLSTMAKEAKTKPQDKELNKKAAIIKKIKEILEKNEFANNLIKEEKKLVKDLNLLTLKPFLYTLNVNEEQLKNKKYANPLPASPAGGPNETVIALSAKTEEELGDLSPEEAQEYLRELGLAKSGLEQLTAAAYQLLNLITFFTIQSNKVQAWTIESGAKAPQAARGIHTDFAHGFIRAEVISWQDLVKCGSEAKAKELGLLRIEGKDYIVKDGDVVHFRFNV